MEKEHYPIIDKSYREILLEELEDETVPLVNAAANTFYKIKGEVLANTIGIYINTRFTKRIQRFAKEEKLLSPKQIKDFYENINEEQLDILFELLDKARTSTYELHAKVLSCLYIKYLEKKELSYYESSLLSNISLLNKDDFIYLYKLLKEEKNSPLFTNNICEVSAIKKFVSSGILSENEINNFGGVEDKGNYCVNFKLNDFSKDLLEILEKAINE
ncbi:hypothetical protein CRU99_02510 [Malaciobacter mytili]|nr:hypothetical protein CRU99_02510 [Malaciobacter mytili]